MSVYHSHHVFANHVSFGQTQAKHFVCVSAPVSANMNE